MYIWEKIHETNELKHLFIKSIEIDNKLLTKEWEGIYNQYLKEFGISEKYQSLLESKRKIAIKQAKYILTKDRILLTEINLEKEALKTLDSGEIKTVSFRQNCINIEKSQGVKINPLKITVLDYFTYLKHLSNG